MSGLPNSLLSNIENKDRELIIEAAKLTCFTNIIRLKDKAYNSNKRILKHCFAVHTTDRTIDHGKFWGKYFDLRSLRREQDL